MKKTFRVHLRSGTTIKFKAADFEVKYTPDEGFTEWSSSDANRWLFFLPKDLVAVERIR